MAPWPWTCWPSCRRGCDVKHLDDDLTVDLLEGEPVKMTRTNADRKRAMCYQGPKDRPCCRSCRHVETVVHFENTAGSFERHWCRIGGFRVMLGGVCRDYQAAPGRKGW